jgi:hypothetical protein
VATTGNPELDGFIAKYTPEIAAQAHAAIARMRLRLPDATVLVYDNYNALAVGFGADEKVANIILSITAYPRWVTLFFMYGVSLDDPDGLLEGSGSQVRSIRFSAPETLDDPRIEALIANAVARAEVPLNPNATGEIIIKSVSAKQRPRRPVGG